MRYKPSFNFTWFVRSTAACNISPPDSEDIVSSGSGGEGEGIGVDNGSSSLMVIDGLCALALALLYEYNS